MDLSNKVIEKIEEWGSWIGNVSCLRPADSRYRTHIRIMLDVQPAPMHPKNGDGGTCYQTILRTFGVEPIGMNEYWDLKRARINRRELLAMSGAAQFYDQFLARWMEMIEQSSSLALDIVQEGVISRLQEWKRRGAGFYLVTMRRDKQALEDQMVDLNLRPLLDEVMIVDHTLGGEGKASAVRKRFPGKEIDGDCIWIGDTEADWEAGGSLGCRVILLFNGLRDEAYLRSLKGAVVRPSIAALSNDVWSDLYES